MSTTANFPILPINYRGASCARALDAGAKTCHTPRHDGVSLHLLHYYRELT